MNNSIALGRKALTWTVVAATILWAMSAAFIAIPLTASAATLTAGDLIRGTEKSPYGGYPVYYYGSNGQRYLFPTASTYASWFGSDFSMVKVLTQAEVGAIPLGGNATIKPTSKLVKADGPDPKVYAVGKGGVLRHVSSEAVAVALYGADWSKGIVTLPEGFFANYTTGAAVAAATDYDKTAVAASAADIGTDKGLSATPAAAVATGSLTVSAASDNPSAGVLPGSASSVVVLKFNVTAGAAAQTVTGATVKSIGVGSANDFSAVYLYDGATRLTSGRTLGSQTRSTEFAGLSISVAANSTKTLTVVVDTNSLTTGTLATAGDTHAFQLAALGTTASVSGLPLTGATQSIGSQGVSATSVTSGSAPSNPTIGQTAVPISEFRVSAGTNDAEFRRITVTVGGTVSVSDLANFTLWQAGTKLADGVRSSDRVTFDLSAAPFTITQGANRLFQIKADVGGRGDRTITTYVDSVYPSDVLVVDKVFGYGAQVRWGTDTNTTCADEAGVTEFCSLAEGRTVTTQGGRVTVAFNGPPAADASISSQDVPLSKFTLTAGEQPLEIRNLRLNLAESGAQVLGLLEAGAAGTVGESGLAAGTDYFTDIKIKDADTGAVIMGPVELAGATQTSMNSATAASSALWTLTGTWTLNANQSRKLVITADLANVTAGTDFISRAYTMALNTYVVGDFREVSTGQNVLAADVIGLQSAITGNAVTIRSSSLTAGVASSPVSGTTVKGTNGVSAVGFTLTSGTSSAVKVTQVIVRGLADSDDDGTAGALGAAAEDLRGGDATAANLDSVVLSAQLYDGATAVSSLKSPSSGVITFDNMNWTIPAGTTKNLMVKTNLSTTQLNSNTDYFMLYLGIGDITAQDKDSNPLTSVPSAQVNATASIATATTIFTTISANGSITAAADGATPLSTIVLSGAQDVSFLKVRLTASNEAFNLTKVGIKQTVTGASDGIAAVKIKYPKADGTTGTATSTLSSGVADFSGLDGYLALDRASVLEVLANVATISETGISGDLPVLALDFDTNFEVVGAGSGTTVTSVGAADISGNAMTLRKTKPTVTLSAASPSGASVPGLNEQLRFTVAADAAGDVILDAFTFKVNSTVNGTTAGNLIWNQAGISAAGAAGVEDGNLSRSDLSIYDASNTTTELEGTGTTASGDANWTLFGTTGTSLVSGTAGAAGFAGETTNAVVGFARVTFTTSVTVSAGTSKTFIVKLDSTGASSASDDTVRFDVQDETTTVAGNESQWDEINSTSLAGSATDISGSLVKNLPVTGGTLVF